MSTLYLAARQTPPGTAAAEQSKAARHLADLLLTAAGHTETHMTKEPGGRPTVSVPGLALSVTHTGTWVFCALLAAKRAETRLGIDAEVVRDYPHREKLATRYFGPYERARVAADPTPRAFFACFTAKEAFAKYCGDGLSRHLAGDDTAAPDFEATHGVRFFTREQADVLLTFCLPAGECPKLLEI